MLSNVQILHGCEINVLNGGKLSLEQKYIDFLDYAIVGIHKECYTDEGKKEHRQLDRMYENEKYILSLTRMMLIHHLTMNVSFQLPNSTGSLWKSTTVRWSKKDRRLNCYENYRKMLKLCEQQQVPIIISSDAHDPSWVGRFDLAVKLLEELQLMSL